MATAQKNRKLYHLHLTGDERSFLVEFIRRGKAAGWRIQRAQALLKVDEAPGAPAWTDQKTVEALGMGIRTLEGWRKQAVEHGPLSLLERMPQERPKQRKLDGAGEAELVRIACSKPPEGRKSWSLSLLADQLVVLEVVGSISKEAVRQTLKKTR